MEKLKPKTIQLVKQKLICSTPLQVLIKNDSKHVVEYEIEEEHDGVKPKLMIKIKKLKLKRKLKGVRKYNAKYKQLAGI